MREIEKGLTDAFSHRVQQPDDMTSVERYDIQSNQHIYLWRQET